MTAIERLAAAEMTLAFSQRISLLYEIDAADSYDGRHHKPVQAARPAVQG
ncbi:hypothetical protein [Nonomuraea rubra]|uniref:Uncharacterized protein n=1 Tax=Nonomuraea rubra TaxID=46180 RepID=A0A7X0P6N4_9ACTN|nr:hypothetical protein [Nonomuraea rubra]MBB6556255.1 hypothetical protein [Nonomuraea rubra]